MSKRQSWNSLRRMGIRGEKHCFHLVCYRELAEELKQVEDEFFVDFDKGDREALVNMFITAMAPFLLHHLNMQGMVPTFNLKAGNTPPLREKGEDDEQIVMDSHLWVALDRYNYRLLKKLHEVGGAAASRTTRPGGTFSMAMVLRSLLVLVLGLIKSLGRDGFLLWVENWLKEFWKKTGTKFREAWKPLDQHMWFFKAQKVKYIGLYSSGYEQIHLYHPPPGK